MTVILRATPLTARAQTARAQKAGWAMASPSLDPAAFAATMPFAVANGIELSAVGAEAVVGHIDWASTQVQAVLS